jgi:hypothetical protein
MLGIISQRVMMQGTNIILLSTRPRNRHRLVAPADVILWNGQTEFQIHRQRNKGHHTPENPYDQRYTHAIRLSDDAPGG